MAKIKRTKDGEVIYNMDLTQDEVNAISYALEISSECEDTYDVDTHDYLQEFFAEMWQEDFDEEEGPADFSGYSTSIVEVDNDTQSVVLDFQERLTKIRQAHWEDE